MRALSTLLESPGCIAAMERHPAAITSLVPRLMGSFSGEHWQEVALALLRLVGGAGMGELVEPPSGHHHPQSGSGSGAAPDQQEQPPARRHASDWRARLLPAQRVDSAGAALTVVEAVAAHVGHGGRLDSMDSVDGGGGGGGTNGRPSSGSDLFRASFGAYASHNLEAAARFLGQLYDSLNSVLTESASLVVELHRAVGLGPARVALQPEGAAAGAGAPEGDLPPAAVAAAAQGVAAAAADGGQEGDEAVDGDDAAESRQGGGQQQQQQPGQGPPQPPPERLSQSQLQQRYRRAAALVDVSIALLRLLEATARDAPAVFLCGATAPLAMARLVELMSFVLRHYCSGAEARRLGQLLRQRSIALARQRRNGGAAGGAAAARAAFPMPPGSGTLNFNVPVPGIGNLTFLVHTGDEGQEGQDGEEDRDGDEGAAGEGGGAAAAGGGRGNGAGGQSPVERLARAAVLAPLAGTVVNLALAEQLPDESPDGATTCAVRTTAALVGTKQLRQRTDGGRAQILCPAGAPRRRSFVEQLTASDIPLESLRQLVDLDWLQLEASRKLLRPERTAGAVAGLLLQDSNDLRSGADALLEERRRSHAASPTLGVHPEHHREGSPQPMEVDEGEEAAVMRSWGEAVDGAGGSGSGGRPGSEPGPALRQQLEQLQSILDAVAARRVQLAGGGTARTASGTLMAAAEAAPDEFLDPLTAALMEDPVVLPASRMVVDRSTIARYALGYGLGGFGGFGPLREGLSSLLLMLEATCWLLALIRHPRHSKTHPHHHHHHATTTTRHLTYQATDPFSRSPLAIEEVIPDEQLAARIREWQLRQPA